MRYGYRKNFFTTAIKKDMPFYMISAVFLIAGVVIGSIAIKVLEYEQKKDLVVYMNRFFQLVTKEEVRNSSLFFYSVKNNFQTVFFIWILSMTVIGIPFTLFMVSFKGFVSGFTIAFLVEGFGFKGLLFFIAAILPPNLLMIACMMVLSVTSLKYSLGLLKKNFVYKGTNTVHMTMASFSATTGIVFLVMTVASGIEAFFSSVIVNMISQMIIVK